MQFEKRAIKREKKEKKKRSLKQLLIGLAAMVVVLALVLTYPLTWLTKRGLGEAQATIVITAKGIGHGLDPKGDPFEIDEIKDSVILQEAIWDMEMSNTLNVEDVARRISIRPIVSGDVLSRLTTPPEAGSLEVQDRTIYPNQFVVSLSDEGMPSLTETKALLDAVMEAYRSHLELEYVGEEVEPGYSQDSLMLLDYPEILMALGQQADSLVRRVEGYSAVMSEFTSYEGVTFGDILARCRLLRNTQITDMQSLVRYFCLTKDKSERITYERMALERSSVTLNAAQGAAEGIADMVRIYDNSTNYVVPSSETIGSMATGGNDGAFYSELTTQLIDAKQHTIDAKYNREQILKMIEKIEGDEMLSSTEKAAMTAAIDQSVLDTLTLMQSLRAQIDRMSKEYYDTHVTGEIKISSASYRIYTEGSLITNIIAILVLVGICLILYRVAAAKSYLLDGVLVKVKAFRAKLENKSEQI